MSRKLNYENNASPNRTTKGKNYNKRSENLELKNKINKKFTRRVHQQFEQAEEIIEHE